MELTRVYVGARADLRPRVTLPSDARWRGIVTADASDVSTGL